MKEPDETATYLDGAPVERDTDMNIIPQPTEARYPDGSRFKYDMEGKIIPLTDAAILAIYKHMIRYALEYSEGAPVEIRRKVVGRLR